MTCLRREVKCCLSLWYKMVSFHLQLMCRTECNLVLYKRPRNLIDLFIMYVKYTIDNKDPFSLNSQPLYQYHFDNIFLNNPIYLPDITLLYSLFLVKEKLRAIWILNVQVTVRENLWGHVFMERDFQWDFSIWNKFKELFLFSIYLFWHACINKQFQILKAKVIITLNKNQNETH